MVAPTVSVVTSVHDAAEFLRDSIESILSQEGIDLEFILVDDGSSDASGAILDEYAARDSRVRVIHQENQGLTRALIHGCAEARGEFIARHDADDKSMPGRLAKQLELARDKPHGALFSSGSRVVGPAGEVLDEVIPDPSQATRLLRAHSLAEIRGPAHHGTALFRKKDYLAVGGYRPQFYFAQDLDLWIRLAEIGEHVVAPELLYEARLAPSSISRRHRREQFRFGDLALRSAERRRHGLPDDEILAESEGFRRPIRRGLTRREEAATFYFYGSCLRRRGDSRARGYFVQSVRRWPFQFRALARVVAGAVGFA